MIIRMRIYESQGVDHVAADRVFYDQVKPVHERHGATFVGRFRDQEERVVVMWSYTDEAACRRIQEAVAADPSIRSSAAQRREKGLHACQNKELFLRSTDPQE
jgi:hypothetical protein